MRHFVMHGDIRKLANGEYNFVGCKKDERHAPGDGES